MTGTAKDLKEHLRRVGSVKSDAPTPSSPGEGIEQTILHSDEHLAAFGARPERGDAEFQVWLRVREHLRSLAR